MTTLKELQHALAAKLTSTSTDSCSQPDLLADFQLDELEQSRETLLRKRLSQVASLLPRTRRALATEFGELCRAFVAQHHFNGYTAPQVDAISFARWLHGQSNIDDWKLELATWEALHVEWSTYSFICRCKRFSFNVQDSLSDDSQPQHQRSIWVVLRMGRWGRWQRLV